MINTMFRAPFASFGLALLGLGATCVLVPGQAAAGTIYVNVAQVTGLNDGSTGNGTGVVDGFTVRGGNASGTGGNTDRGGGILCVGGASPTIRSCVFVANRCTFGGGAGYINASSPSFTDVRFDTNVGG